MNVGTTYNGWSNRETWLANLWLTSEEPFVNLLEEAGKLLGDTYVKAEWLEERFHHALDELFGEATLWADLLGAALGRVNWYELIENT